MHPKKNSGVGLHIAAARKRAGLTQEELAERLHVTRQTISNYESMRSQPDIQMLAQLAKCLQVPVEELIYGRGGSQYCSRAYIGMSGFCRNLGIIVYVLGVLYGIRLGSGAKGRGERSVLCLYALGCSPRVDRGSPVGDGPAGLGAHPAAAGAAGRKRRTAGRMIGHRSKRTTVNERGRRSTGAAPSLLTLTVKLNSLLD